MFILSHIFDRKVAMNHWIIFAHATKARLRQLPGSPNHSDGPIIRAFPPRSLFSKQNGLFRRDVL